jgi:hypothetical protein
MAIDWIQVEDNPIPDHMYTDRDSLLLQDEDGFIGIGYWNSYDWVLEIPGYRVEHDNSTFKRIKFYAFLD